MGTDWRLSLALVLFMELENYTVTFPAFLLEISNRSGLSIQDRDPGCGETGSCSNHFLHHHFLQVDEFETVSPQHFRNLCCHRNNSNLILLLPLNFTQILISLISFDFSFHHTDWRATISLQAEPAVQPLV